MSALLLAGCLALVPAVSRVAVQVDASTNLVLGRQDAVDGALFGLTAFEGFPGVVADADYLGRLVALRPGAFRFPASSTWYGPPDEQSAADWFPGDAAARIFEQTLLFGSRYPLARFLRLTRWLGAEPMLQLGGVPEWLPADDTGIPLDFQRWADLGADIIELARRFDPGLTLVQVWNEPNASWFRSVARFADHEGGCVGAHVELFNLTARAVKQRCPGVLVGGPVLCWPPTWPPRQEGQQPWYTWQGWTLPFLEGTADTCDFFDFHTYGVTAPQVATQLELIAAASEQLCGRRLPTWITESNYDLDEQYRGTPEEWARRAIPYERFLWGLLAQTDKLAGNLVHDLHAHRHCVLPGPDAPRAVYWVLWIFRDLRGPRLLADSADPDVKVAATSREDLVNVVCFNGGEEAKDVDLSVRIPSGYWTGPEVRALVSVEGTVGFQPGSLAVQHERAPGLAKCALTLAPGSTVSLGFRAQAFLTPARRVVMREVFADQTMLPLAQSGAEAKLALTLPDDFAAHEARLRVGLLGPAEGLALRVSVNGEEQTLDDPTEWQELPGAGLVAGANVVTLSPSGRVPDNLVAAFVSAAATTAPPAAGG